MVVAVDSRSISQGAEKFEVVDTEMAEVLSRKSPAERLQISHQLWRHAVDLLDAQLRAQYPRWSVGRRSKEVAERMASGSW